MYVVADSPRAMRAVARAALRAGVDAIDELQRRNAQIARERTGLE